MGASETIPPKSIHGFTVKDIKGQDVDLSIYKGKVLLVLNVTSKCGFTDANYTQLTDLYRSLQQIQESRTRDLGIPMQSDFESRTWYQPRGTRVSLYKIQG